MSFRMRVNADDADRFISKWNPVVLRFFHLCIGDSATAEALTIDTFAEYFRDPDTTLSDEGAAFLLLRLALAKGSRADTPQTQSSDRLVRALAVLEPTCRALVVLFRVLSLDLGTIAEITDMNCSQLRRMLVDGLCELRQGLLLAERMNPIGHSPEALREVK